MLLGSTRVLRERKQSRPLPEDYNASPQISHTLPQAYGTDVYYGYPPSEPTTGYNSPASSNWLPDDTSIAGDADYGRKGVQYVGHLPLRSYGRGTPPTPARSDISVADPRYTNSTHWTRSTVAPKSKPKKSKKEKKIVPKSAMPGDEPVPILSEDCKEPIEIIKAFVNRPTEDRLKEVEGKNGYTPRPMNNFMLYRKAYQEKAKKVSSQNNHQVVSVVVAASWKNESKEIKDKFAEFAQKEKDNHILAFPNYQFRPNKSNKGRKRKAGELEDELSDLEDLDWRRVPPANRGRQRVPPRLPTRYTPEPQHQYIATSYPYPQAGYAIDYNNQHLYYDQPQQWYQPHLPLEELPWQDSNGFQDHLHSDFNITALSGLPGGGDVLLEPDFSNAVFGDPVPTSQAEPLLPSNDFGMGAFTQQEFESLEATAADPAPEWQDPRPSIDAKTLTAAFKDYADENNEEFFNAGS